MSVKPPNYTQTPNELFALMPAMKDAELRVTLAIVRETFGWQLGGQAVELSLSDLMARTGLSRQGVLNGLKAGRGRTTIYQVKGQGAGKSGYGLVVHEVDQSTTLTSPRGRPLVVNDVDQSSQRGRPLVVHEVDHQTPISSRPSAEEMEGQRKLKERETKGKKKTLVADATASVPQDDDQNLQPHPTGFHQPSGEAQQEANAQSGNATSSETVPGGAAGPVEKPVDNARPAGQQTAYVQVIAAWNAHCAPLPQVETVNDGRKKSVRKLLADCGGDVEKAVQTVTDATREVVSDPFWLERRYSFDNLVPGKVFARAEAWRSRPENAGPAATSGVPDPTPSMAELMAAAPLNPLPGGRK